MRLMLASGPLLLLLACSVYDGSLETDAAVGGSSPGEGGSAAGVESKSGAAGTDVGGSGAGHVAGSGSSSGESPAGSAGTGGSSTSGGTSATGGSSSGGTETAGTSAGGEPALQATVVDDMEDADPQITVANGRNGFWYVGNDLTAGGTQDPPTDAFAMCELTAGERDVSSYAAHTKVSGFKGWGSVIGFNLAETGGVKAYDASAYCGVQFWGKAAGATPLRFRAPDGDTHPGGKICKESGATNELCYDHFSAPVALTSSWKSFTVMFDSLEQIGTGYHPSDKKFKPAQLFSIEWAIPGTNGKAYEIWLDDIALLTCP